MHHGARLLTLWLAMVPLGAAVPAANASSAPSVQSGSSVRVYKWTDDQGVVHYGDNVPAEYAHSERAVLNGQGVEISRLPGLKDAALQNAADQAAQAAQQRAQHDAFLLATYASAQELERLRDERLDQIDGQIKAASSYIDSLGARLAALEERAMHFEPYSSDPSARRMPDELAEELVHTVDESRSQRTALEAKRQEKVDMRTQFEADLQRYRELATQPH